MMSTEKHIAVTDDDILIRPYFDLDGVFRGYVAHPAPYFDQEKMEPATGDLFPTAAEAVNDCLHQAFPEPAVRAFGRRFVESSSDSYDVFLDHDALQESLRRAFPSMPETEIESAADCIGRECEKAVTEKARAAKRARQSQ